MLAFSPRCPRSRDSIETSKPFAPPPRLRNGDTGWLTTIRNGTAPQSALAEYAPETRIAGACAELCAEDNAGQQRIAVVTTNLHPRSTAFGRRNDAPGSGRNWLVGRRSQAP